MIKTVKAYIEEEEKSVYLVFDFDEKIKLNLLSDEKDNILKVFYNLLSFVNKKTDVKFNFVKGKSDLYNEVCEKYIADLEEELESLKEKYYE